jgi:hypothetical protein
MLSAKEWIVNGAAPALRALAPALRVAAVVFGIVFHSVGSAQAEDGYRLGHGYDIGPFNIAGYSNLVANLPTGGTKSLTLDDLSAFVSGHLGRLINPFTEAELTHFDLARSGPKNGDADFVLERLYNDTYLTDSVTLRLGKMLAPVGAWNVIHAAPLVLTTARPAVTDRDFSEYISGASLQYSDPTAHFPDVQLYWQPTGELSERPSSLAYHRYRSVAGAHVSYSLGLLDEIGASFQQSKDINGDDQSLWGFDYHYSIGKLSFQGEATWSDIGHDAAAPSRDTEWGLYTAASYALTDRWSVYSWYESFADRTAPSTAQDVLVGIAYRPQPAIVLRLEYLQNVGGQPVNPTGVTASWSVLF